MLAHKDNFVTVLVDFQRGLYHLCHLCRCITCVRCIAVCARAYKGGFSRENLACLFTQS